MENNKRTIPTLPTESTYFNNKKVKQEIKLETAPSFTKQIPLSSVYLKKKPISRVILPHSIATTIQQISKNPSGFTEIQPRIVLKSEPSFLDRKLPFNAGPIPRQENKIKRETVIKETIIKKESIFPIPKDDYKPTTDNTHRLSTEQLQILDVICKKKLSCFFTGDAGTGKSFLLKFVIKKLKGDGLRRDELMVTAPTGIAACNINGITLHGFAGCGLAEANADVLVQKIRKNKKTYLKWITTKVLIIDEISMVDPVFFDKLELVARLIRRCELPFGGIQVVLCGDFMQLPPVNKGNTTKFCFESDSWKRVVKNSNYRLTKIFRQSDPLLISILSEIRTSNLTPKSIEILKSLENTSLSPSAPQLYSLRHEVESANNKRMGELTGPEFTFRSIDQSNNEWDKKKLNDSVLAPASVTLKVGASVMYIRNHKTITGLVNGSIGVVKDILQIDGKYVPQIFFPSLNTTVDVLPEDFNLDNPGSDTPLAKRNQIPLVLAFAMSIHKSQGQSLQEVVVDLSKVFEYGQAYVAISRCVSLSGLKLLRFSEKSVMCHPKVVEFYKTLKVVNESN